MPPLIATPTRPAESATCSTCGETLIRTGNPVTFANIKGLMPKTVKGFGVVKASQPYKGWVPALLVAICPKCDSRDGSTEVAPPPEEVETDDAKRIEAIRMAYLTKKGEEPA